MPKTKMGTQTYSPTMVTRYVSKGYEGWEKIEEFEDATVRDNDRHGYFRVPQAMLRAYSNDPTKYDKHDEHFVCTAEHAKHYGKEMKGFVLDCDGDVALKRIMGLVMDKHSFGHGHEWWIVLVGYDEDENDWDGFGGDNQWRIERWDVEIRSEKETDE